MARSFRTGPFATLARVTRLRAMTRRLFDSPQCLELSLEVCNGDVVAVSINGR